MKKIITVGLVLVVVLSLLTACGKNSGGDNTGEDEGGTSSDVGNGYIDLTDDSIYYAIIDGKKYDRNTSIQDLLNDGYTLSPSENMKQMLDPNKKFDDIYLKKDGETHFAVQLGNGTNKPIPKSECTVFVIGLHRNWYENVTIVHDLTIGSTRAEVEEIFGTDYTWPGSTDRIKVYALEDWRSFTFEYDDSDIVKNIIVRCVEA